MRQKPVSIPLAIVATTIAFGIGIGAGRLAGTGLAIDRTDPVASRDAATSRRYKIPIGLSQPSQGPKEALVTIVEWCDLPDAGCAALEPALRASLARHPDSVRLLFRHFMRENASSALAHKFARSAHEHGGKFWQVRELLQRHAGPFTGQDAERYAQQVGLDFDAISKAIEKQEQASVVLSDRLFATMFDVKEPPAVFVNGVLVQPLTAARLDDLIESELAAAVKLVESGIPKTEIYAELTKQGRWTPLPTTTVRR